VLDGDESPRWPALWSCTAFRIVSFRISFVLAKYP
jgi:hypothetical protein